MSLSRNGVQVESERSEMSIRSTVRAVPVISGVARAVKRAIARRRFPGSASYWERRYLRGGTSGAGSYGRLAQFKAEFVNAFVSDHDVDSVLELGCGDGAQLQLAEYPRYTGVDVAQASVDQCRRVFRDDRSKVFVLGSDVGGVAPHELSLSLDVIYHLVEDEVFNRYMTDLFRLAKRYVIVYSSNVDLAHAAHVRHREFTRWVAVYESGWQLVETVVNRYPAAPRTETADTSFADFYVFARR